MSVLNAGKGVRTDGNIAEVARFLISGVFASATHLGVLYTLVEFIQLWYLAATIIGFCFGFLVSFTLQKYWTFQERTHTRIHGQFAQFFTLQAGGLATNTVGLYVLVEFFGLWYFVAQTLLLVSVAIVTYIISKFFIFTSYERVSTFSHY